MKQQLIEETKHSKKVMKPTKRDLSKSNILEHEKPRQVLKIQVLMLIL